jgi:hypothetical protein
MIDLLQSFPFPCRLQLRLESFVSVTFDRVTSASRRNEPAALRRRGSWELSEDEVPGSCHCSAMKEKLAIGLDRGSMLACNPFGVDLVGAVRLRKEKA